MLAHTENLMNTEIIRTYGLQFSFQDLIEKILSASNTHLVVFCPQEHTPVETGTVSQTLSKPLCDTLCKRARAHMQKNNVTTELVLGRSQFPEVSEIAFSGGQDLSWNQLFSLIFDKIHYLNDWWFKESSCIYLGTHERAYTFPLKYDTLDYICCQRSSLPHYHRSLMMDKLAKYDLINPSFSWRQLSHTYQKFEFKHWQEELMLVNEEPVRDQVPPGNQSIYNVMHQGTMNSLIEVVTESCTDYVFWTEKTTKWLLYGKVFIILGSPEINKQLADLGFQLYDELFDYSFDNNPDLDYRAEAIASQLAELNQTHNTPELRHQLLQKVQPKIQHNYNQLVNIINQDYPAELHDILEAVNFNQNLEWVRALIKPIK